MTVVAGIATLTFILAGTGVGIRLLHLSLRTSGSAERNVGVGLLCICAVGYPCGLTIPVETIDGSVRRLMFAIAMTALAAGSISLVLFVQRVFRRDEAWAAFLMRSFIAGWLVLAGVSHWIAVAAPVEELASIEAPQFFARQGLMILLFGWFALESALCWERMRRRSFLGLAVPEVQNRVALWSLAGAASVLSVTVMTLAFLFGRNPIEDPATLTVVGISGTVSSGAMLLAFLPSRSYLAWVRARRA